MGIYIEDYKSLLWIIHYEREHGGKIVLARGSFDVTLHMGHRDFLKRAKDLGDVLIVNVNNNEWVRKHKNKDMPIIPPIVPEVHRAQLVGDQEMVDYSVVHPAYGEIHPSIELATLIEPDVFVREDKDPEIIELEKKLLLERLGYLPDFVALPRSDYPISTSSLIREIIERAQEKDAEKIMKGIRESYRRKGKKEKATKII